MTEFPRLADDEDGPGAAMLRAARDDVPSADVLRRTLAAVATATAVSFVPAAVAAKTVTKTGAAVLFKYVLVGFASGVVTVGGAAVIHHVATRVAAESPRSAVSAPDRQNPRKTGPAPAPTNLPVPEVEPPSHPVEESAPAAVAPAHHDAGQGVRGAPSHALEPAVVEPAVVEPAPSSSPGALAVDPAMAAEVRLLDEARRDVAAGRGRDALDALARYSREAPSQRLAPEAWYLEMEANRALGDRVAAMRSAKNLLDRYPNGPHANRARRILRGE